MGKSQAEEKGGATRLTSVSWRVPGCGVRFFDERSEQARVLAPLALPLGDKGDALLAKNPALIEEGRNPFSLDSKEPNWANFHDFLMGEVRYLSVKKAYPNEAKELFAEAQKIALLRYKSYVHNTQEDWTE